MKNAIILLILFVSISLTSCGQALLKYDFSKIKSQSEIDALLKKIKQENKDAKIDTVYRFNEITVKGMHYAGVPIKSALITDHYTLLTTDTINFSGKKLLETIEAEKGLTQREETYNDDIEFKWKTETKDLDFKLKLVNGKHLAALGDKDYAELTIKYKPVYDVPLANIHKEIKEYKDEPIYELAIRNSYGEYTVVVNDIIITEATKNKEFYLNHFITTDASSVKIIVKPAPDQNEVRPKVFNENESFSAVVYDKSTNEPVATIENASLAGKPSAEFSLNFPSKLPYYPKAWTEGADLRNDKNLKEKVIALYNKLGKAFLEKDEQTINDMFYQKNYEKQQLNYDTNFETARNKWEALLTVVNNGYKYTVVKDFDIEFDAGGKLIFTFSKNKTDMLIFTGKRFSRQLNYYLYQPKGSNELKIIR